MMAAKNKMVDIVKLLLDRGVDISSKDQVNYLIQNTSAIQINIFSLVPNKKYFNQISLHYTIKIQKCFYQCKLICQNGRILAYLIMCFHQNNYTALSYAATEEMALCLLEANASVDVFHKVTKSLHCIEITVHVSIYRYKCDCMYQYIDINVT